MSKPNVFVHMDGVISAPLCDLGVNIIRAWYAEHALWGDITECCNNTGCTCHVESAVVRKGTEAEKESFYNTIGMLERGSIHL